MSADATLELMAAVRAALIADATIAGYVADRVSTDWGLNLTTPFIRLSAPTVKDFQDDCGDGSEYKLRVHVFARDNGPVARGRIAAQVRAVLKDARLNVAGADSDPLEYQQTLNSPDPEDPTLHMAIVEFRSVTTA